MATSLVLELAGPERATPLLVLGLLLLLVVDLQQVLLHAGGDLRAQVPDEHTAAKTRAQSRIKSMWEPQLSLEGSPPTPTNVTMAKILLHRCPVSLV